MDLTPSLSGSVVHLVKTPQSVQPKSFGCGKEVDLPVFDSASIFHTNSMCKSDSIKSTAVSSASLKDLSIQHSNSIRDTLAVPIVVLNSARFEDVHSPNCFLYPIGLNFYTIYIPKLSSLSYPEHEAMTENENENDMKDPSNGYSYMAKRELRKMRQRTTFTKYIKHRILNLYKQYSLSGAKLSIRSIAAKIYSQLSEESFVFFDVIINRDFDYTFKNIITLLYNTRHKKTM